MKKTGKIFLLLLLMTLPLFTTSCFKDSDADNSYDKLNDEEVAAYLKKMQGSYTGKCYYAYIGKNENGVLVSKMDSIVDVQWTLKENGELTFSRLPVSLFANSLRAESQFDFLADSISKCNDVTAEIKILPYRSMDGMVYPFYIFPKENIVLNIENEGKKYKVVLQYSNTINVLGLYYNMSGECRIYENQMYVQLPIGSSFVNEVQTGSSPSMFKYIGTRKAIDNTK